MFTQMLKPPQIDISYDVDHKTSLIHISITNPNSVGNVLFDIHVYGITCYGHKVTLHNIQSEKESVQIVLDPILYYNVISYTISIDAKIKYNRFGLVVSPETTVAEICESTKEFRYAPVANIPKKASDVVLKAFCNMPADSLNRTDVSDNQFSQIYMVWEYSLDGVVWKAYDLENTGNVSEIYFTDERHPVDLAIPDYSLDIKEDLESSETVSYHRARAWGLYSQSPLDTFLSRADVIHIPYANNNGDGSEDYPTALDNTLYRVIMCRMSKEEVSTADGGTVAKATILSNVLFTPTYVPYTEVLATDFVNASKSKSLYRGGILYGYGTPHLKNNIVPTFPGENVRPQSKQITLDICEDTHVTTLLPWKDYLVAFTEHTAHLISYTDSEYFVRTISTSVGIPDEDCRCCKSTLNGIIFKSGYKIFMMYPNLYSGTDEVLNLTEISQPIESYLEEYLPSKDLKPFALNNSSEYILMLPEKAHTVCLKYKYAERTWTMYDYPVTFTDYEVFAATDTLLYGFVEDTRDCKTFSIDKTYAQIFDNLPYNMPYVDCLYLKHSFEDWETLLENKTLRPIDFLLDSGQKSDQLSVSKQFVESKFILATLHDKDCFPISVTVHVDGEPRVHTSHFNTDSSFWKTTYSHIGTLNSSLHSDSADVFNVFRQMFIRYSGKGKSIRHIIEGKSMYPFKLYEVNYRYRTLNLPKR